MAKTAIKLFLHVVIDISSNVSNFLAYSCFQVFQIHILVLEYLHKKCLVRKNFIQIWTSRLSVVWRCTILLKKEGAGKLLNWRWIHFAEAHPRSLFEGFSCDVLLTNEDFCVQYRQFPWFRWPFQENCV